jgi:hypothetical protein
VMSLFAKGGCEKETGELGISVNHLSMVSTSIM